MKRSKRTWSTPLLPQVPSHRRAPSKETLAPTHPNPRHCINNNSNTNNNSSKNSNDNNNNDKNNNNYYYNYN